MTTYTYHGLTGPDGTPVVMDPFLMRTIAYQRSGRQKPATAGTAGDEVAVIARVDNLVAWGELSEVFPGTAIRNSSAQAGAQEWIVTGRVPIRRLESVRKQPFVKSLKAARRLHPGLAAGTQEILAGAQLPAGMHSTGGKGAVVGLVDIGCDFAHRNFQNAAGHTRLRLIWDQGSAGSSTGGVQFGRLISATEINTALATPNPYQSLGYTPSDSTHPAHGTHVMDIAAGNGRGSGVPGVAPQAELMFVHISSTDVPWESADVVGKNFGDSVQLLEALAFIFQKAGAKPCVINVSLGTNGGPHDGSSLVEQGIDSLLRQQPNRAVVVAASNSFADGIHAQGTVPGRGQLDLPWIVGPQDFTDNEFELWYGNAGRLEAELIDPDGNSLGRVPVNQSGTVQGNGNGDIVVFIANRLDDPNNHDNTIGIFLSPAAAAGTWKVRLHNTTATATGFHAWIERDDQGQSTFAPPLDNTHTLGSISCGHETIVVGSYDAHATGQPLSFFSSEGPTRDQRQKPEISAPGHNVRAAASRTFTGTTRMSGTSMASPMVTGTVALVLAEAAARHHNLSVSDIRSIMQASARHGPPAGIAAAWDSRYGFGRVSASGAVNAVIQLASGATTAAPGVTATVAAALSTTRKLRVITGATRPRKHTAHGKKTKGRRAGGRR